MKYQIHTIPVLDALREPGGCAFCAMKRRLEENAMAFMNGRSYMEEDVRMETNRLGFCAKHLKALYAEQNRLGLGLMLHTFMQQFNKDVGDAEKNNIAGIPIPRAKKNNLTERLRKHFAEVNDSCYLCDMVEGTFARYVDTFLHLWSVNKDAADLIRNQKGYCVPHFTVLLETAGKALPFDKQEKFLREVLPAQKDYMREMEADLDWFTQKFDYRNADAPWKNSREALQRAIKMLSSEENEIQ